MRTGADRLVQALYHHGVRCLFGMPGSHSTHLYDALQRHGGIETVLCRNEQAGAFMADGYARRDRPPRRHLHHGRPGRDQRPDWRGRGLCRFDAGPAARRPGESRPAARGVRPLPRTRSRRRLSALHTIRRHRDGERPDRARGTRSVAGDDRGPSGSRGGNPAARLDGGRSSRRRPVRRTAEFSSDTGPGRRSAGRRTPSSERAAPDPGGGRCRLRKLRRASVQASPSTEPLYFARRSRRKSEPNSSRCRNRSA